MKKLPCLVQLPENEKTFDYGSEPVTIATFAHKGDAWNYCLALKSRNIRCRLLWILGKKSEIAYFNPE